MIGKLTIKEPKLYVIWNLYIKEDGEWGWEEDFNTQAEAVEQAQCFLDDGIDCTIESESLSYGEMSQYKARN